MERIVIYTPASDFFYNGSGAYIIAYLSLAIVCGLAGFGCTLLILPSRTARGNPKSVLVLALSFAIILYIFTQKWLF